MSFLKQHSNDMIRFRHWSRKAYAAFASLGKHVTIGHVCKSIAEASLCKSVKLCFITLSHYTDEKETNELCLEESEEMKRQWESVLAVIKVSYVPMGIVYHCAVSVSNRKRNGESSIKSILK